MPTILLLATTPLLSTPLSNVNICLNPYVAQLEAAVILVVHVHTLHPGILEAAITMPSLVTGLYAHVVELPNMAWCDLHGRIHPSLLLYGWQNCHFVHHGWKKTCGKITRVLVIGMGASQEARGASGERYVSEAVPLRSVGWSGFEDGGCEYELPDASRNPISARHYQRFMWPWNKLRNGNVL